MEILEFRPPQFSEDVAWLPCWLQQNQTMPCSEQVIESHHMPAIKEFRYGAIHKEEDVDLFPKDSGCNRCCLVLSGQGSLPASLAQSSENVLHFHLHLSSYGTSECTPTQHLDASLHLLESNNVQSIHSVEASLALGENVSSNKDLMDNVVCQSLANTENHASQQEEKLDVKYLKNSEVNNAIELSIVASEALVIHDLLKSELDSETLPVEAVLEVSLQVKKARSELLENAFQSLNEEADLSDSLSDLDDLMMKDSFDDVGLSCSFLNNDERICETTVFDVQDTPVTSNHSPHGIQCNSVDMRSQQEKSEDDSTQKQLEENFDMTTLEGFLLEPAGYNIQTAVSDDIGLASVAPNFFQLDDSMLHQSAQKKSDELVVEQKIAFSTVHSSMYSPHCNANSSLHDCNTVAASIEEGVALNPDRFKSRWLGGWTVPFCKELDVTEQLRQSDGKIIPALFVHETSFLSESADIAPDENSCVQRCELQSQVASQSSVSFGYLDDKDDKEWLVSEEVVKCSPSLVNPLCSFVPCSLSLDTDCSEHNLNENKHFTKECLSALPEIEVENPEKMPDSNIEFQDKPKSASSLNTVVSFKDGGGSRLSIRRQLTSLKTYSVVLPSQVASLEARKLGNNHSHQLQCNMRALSPDPHLNCTRKFVEPLPSWSPFKARIMDTVVDHQTGANQNSAAEITEGKTKSDEVANDGCEFLVQSVKKTIAPDILNQSLQASEPITNKSFTENHHLQSSGSETASDPQKIQSLMKIQDDDKNSLEPLMPVQKRVRFSESNDQQSRDLQKLLRSPKNCKGSAFRAGKRRKSNQQLLSRVHNGDCYLKSRSCRAGKRLIFQGIQFLLTGFSSRKEKDIQGLVWNFGGVILYDIPCPSSTGKKMSNSNCKRSPIILSPKKLQTTKFLYGCAVNALIVNVSWLTDSIAAGFMLPPWKYMIISNQAACAGIGRPIRHSSRRYIFEKLGVMLQGKQGFCIKLAKVLKHAGGKVFKTLQWLVKNLTKKKISVGVIVVEDEYKASRHLKQCALEQEIPMMSGTWVIKSLHLGELLPLTENKRSTILPNAKVSNVPAFKDV